jgi:hypothetical protein
MTALTPGDGVTYDGHSRIIARLNAAGDKAELAEEGLGLERRPAEWTPVADLTLWTPCQGSCGKATPTQDYPCPACEGSDSCAYCGACKQCGSDEE